MSGIGCWQNVGSSGTSITALVPHLPYLPTLHHGKAETKKAIPPSNSFKIIQQGPSLRNTGVSRTVRVKSHIKQLTPTYDTTVLYVVGYRTVLVRVLATPTLALALPQIPSFSQMRRRANRHHQHPTKMSV